MYMQCEVQEKFFAELFLQAAIQNSMVVKFRFAVLKRQ
jgi:hypothetical protein